MSGAKEYALFAGDRFYPRGGWDDILHVFVQPMVPGDGDALRVLDGAEFPDHMTDGWAMMVDMEEHAVMGRYEIDFGTKSWSVYRCMDCGAKHGEPGCGECK